MRIDALVFDLDACLAPADEVGRHLFQPVLDALRRENHGRLRPAELEQLFEDTFRFALDDLAARYGLDAAMKDAMFAAYAELEVQDPMRGYGDLDRLDRLPGKKFLVTSGFRRMQESKIRALGLRSRMDGVYIDVIDEPGRKGKKGLFQQILAEHELTPARVVVVGDNPAAEITAGRQLGMPTVQILRPGVEKGAGADRHVPDLAGLAALLEEWP